MNDERVIRFTCSGAMLAGILHRPATPGPVGVLVVVGGPQYRVGSHRQFVLLSRHLADRGIASLRFDCRGMGDSPGDFPGFEGIGPDIAAATDALLREVPALRRVVVWGLCDAASAALMHAHEDERIAGLVLLNPWVRSDQTLARTYLRHYYLQRLASRDFWGKVFSGRFRPREAAADLGGQLRHSVADDARLGFVERMRRGLAAFRGPVLLVLSGNDLTAAEFRAVAEGAGWRDLCARANVSRLDVPGATHTFSSSDWRATVADATADFVRRLADIPPGRPARPTDGTTDG